MKNNILKIYIAAIYCCSTFIIFAQDPGSESNNSGLTLESNDAAAAPINDWIIPFILLGCIVGYYIISKRKELTKI